MRLGVDIIELDGRGGRIFYHPENDAVLICTVPTDNQIDGFEDFDELVLDITDEETETWNIEHTYDAERFISIGEALKNKRKVKK